MVLLEGAPVGLTTCAALTSVRPPSMSAAASRTGQPPDELQVFGVFPEVPSLLETRNERMESPVTMFASLRTATC